MLFEKVAYKVKVELSFCHKAVILSLSKLNIESKTYFTKVAQFGILLGIIKYKIFEKVAYKVKVELSFGLKAIILSLSKLTIKSENFFYKSCSFRYAIL